MWRPCIGLALAVATRLGVKLGTVVAMRLRSNALVCFDDGEDWSSRHTGQLERMSPSAAVDTQTIGILNLFKLIQYSNISQFLHI